MIDAPPPSIRDVRDKLAWNPVLRWRVRGPETVDMVVVHHTATRLRNGQSILEHLSAINRQHIQKQAWPRIAYHFVIGPYGTIWQCNDVLHQTNHSGNRQMNSRSLGVCLLGNFSTGEPTPQQLTALRWLVMDFGYPAIGHKEVVQTTCPGGWWDSHKAWVNGQDAETMKVEDAAEGPVSTQAPAPKGGTIQLLARILLLPRIQL